MWRDWLGESIGEESSWSELVWKVGGACVAEAAPKVSRLSVAWGSASWAEREVLGESNWLEPVWEAGQSVCVAAETTDEVLESAAVDSAQGSGRERI